jgi:Na+-translocating ferredoxin:NAD+ oxidoreductase RnfD subunit
VLGPYEAASLVFFAALAFLIAGIVFIWPRSLAWPAGIAALWTGLSLVVRSVKAWRARPSR